MPDGEFHSTVSPAEFVEVLNGMPKIEGQRHLGDLFIQAVAGLPRAMILPNGLFVTHGGIPHSDIQRQATGLSSLPDKLVWLHTPPCLQDMTWTRITRFPKKMPNRESTGCSYGFLDFKSFAEVMSGDAKISSLLTGHDHPSAGFDQHESWQEHQALTLTGFGFGDDYMQPDAYREKYRESLFIGRLGNAGVPEIISIPVDREKLNCFYQQTLSSRFVNSNSV